MSKATLVIMAAGRAQRYGSVKPLASIGPFGEAVVDILLHDAAIAGFTNCVIVINQVTGATIQEHVHRKNSNIPYGVTTSFVTQEHQRGTTDAVLCASEELATCDMFAVTNADDVYGIAAMRTMAHHVLSAQTNCLIGYHLTNTVLSDEPVSRGVCHVKEGRLLSLHERTHVRRGPLAFHAGDGQSPEHLSPDTVVSMNFWGLTAPTLHLLQDLHARHDFGHTPEMALPVSLNHLVQEHSIGVDVHVTSSRCIGVTHATDLLPAQRALREQRLLDRAQ